MTGIKTFSPREVKEAEIYMITNAVNRTNKPKINCLTVTHTSGRDLVKYKRTTADMTINK